MQGPGFLERTIPMLIGGLAFCVPGALAFATKSELFLVLLVILGLPTNIVILFLWFLTASLLNIKLGPLALGSKELDFHLFVCIFIGAFANGAAVAWLFGARSSNNTGEADARQNRARGSL